jgi:CMP-N,N'-diacetyllegionaminic acid synthase
MNFLYVIPARFGSKGLPGKNIKPLGGRPLIEHSIDFALENMNEGDELCISTNDSSVLEIAAKMNVSVPFIRPDHLATDNASTYDVLSHALNHYEEKDQKFDAIVLLQPTSPFRSKTDLQLMMEIYDSDIDMIVSVKVSKENPYFTLFEEDEHGFLVKSKVNDFTRRQDCPQVLAFNGSIYIINTASFKQNNNISLFKKIKKYIMPESRSIDIDTGADWVLAEYYLQNQ